MLLQDVQPPGEVARQSGIVTSGTRSSTEMDSAQGSSSTGGVKKRTRVHATAPSATYGVAANTARVEAVSDQDQVPHVKAACAKKKSRASKPSGNLHEASATPPRKSGRVRHPPKHLASFTDHDRTANAQGKPYSWCCF